MKPINLSHTHTYDFIAVQVQYSGKKCLSTTIKYGPADKELLFGRMSQSLISYFGQDQKKRQNMCFLFVVSYIL